MVLALLQGWTWSTGLASLLWHFSRVYCTARNWRLLGGKKVELWINLLPLKDLIYLVLWFSSLVGDTVRWGPRLLKLNRNGTMTLIRKDG